MQYAKTTHTPALAAWYTREREYEAVRALAAQYGEQLCHNARALVLAGDMLRGVSVSGIKAGWSEQERPTGFVRRSGMWVPRPSSTWGRKFAALTLSPLHGLGREASASGVGANGEVLVDRGMVFECESVLYSGFRVTPDAPPHREWWEGVGREEFLNALHCHTHLADNHLTVP